MSFVALYHGNSQGRRRGNKPDANHANVRDGLKRVPGMVVHDTTQGDGSLDLICSYKGRLRFLEVKDGAKKPSARKLTEKEQAFMAKFSEFCAVVLSLDDALREMGVT